MKTVLVKVCTICINIFVILYRNNNNSNIGTKRYKDALLLFLLFLLLVQNSQFFPLLFKSIAKKLYSTTFTYKTKKSLVSTGSSLSYENLESTD